jgi:hypothetical protein
MIFSIRSFQSWNRCSKRFCADNLRAISDGRDGTDARSRISLPIRLRIDLRIRLRINLALHPAAQPRSRRADEN